MARRPVRCDGRSPDARRSPSPRSPLTRGAGRSPDPREPVRRSRRDAAARRTGSRVPAAAGSGTAADPPPASPPPPVQAPPPVQPRRTAAARDAAADDAAAGAAWPPSAPAWSAPASASLPPATPPVEPTPPAEPTRRGPTASPFPWELAPGGDPVSSPPPRRCRRSRLRRSPPRPCRRPAGRLRVGEPDGRAHPTPHEPAPLDPAFDGGPQFAAEPPPAPMPWETARLPEVAPESADAPAFWEPEPTQAIDQPGWDGPPTQAMDQSSWDPEPTQLILPPAESFGAAAAATELLGASPDPANAPTSALDALFGESRFREYEAGADESENPFAREAQGRGRDGQGRRRRDGPEGAALGGRRPRRADRPRRTVPGRHPAARPARSRPDRHAEREPVAEPVADRAAGRSRCAGDVRLGRAARRRMPRPLRVALGRGVHGRRLCRAASGADGVPWRVRGRRSDERGLPGRGGAAVAARAAVLGARASSTSPRRGCTPTCSSRRASRRPRSSGTTATAPTSAS